MTVRSIARASSSAWRSIAEAATTVATEASSSGSTSKSALARSIRPAGKRTCSVMPLAASSPLNRSFSTSTRTSAPLTITHPDPLYTPDNPSARPIPTTALSALLARLSLPTTDSLRILLLTCLTHPSYEPAKIPSRLRKTETTTDPNSLVQEQIESNALLAALGNSLLGLFAAEHLSTLYPNLPTRALKAAVSAYVGPSACFSVARELGVGVNGTEGSAGVPVRWIRDESGGVKLPESSARAKRRAKLAQFAAPGVEIPEASLRWEDVVASTVRAFVAMIYQEKGILAASEFVHANFLSRHLDVSSLLNFRNPKHILSVEIRKLMAEAGARDDAGIETRLLAESGRHSLSPIFNVGLFLPSGLKLSEGHGTSLRMAEHRAAVNALVSIYTVKGDNLSLTLSELGAAPAPSATSNALPSSLHTDFPLGVSLSKAMVIDGITQSESSRLTNGTGVHEREAAFVGKIGLGRSEVLVASGGRSRTWMGKEVVA